MPLDAQKMPLDANVKNDWIEIQKRHDVPVNTIGRRIDPEDELTLRVWLNEGIDQFLWE